MICITFFIYIDTAGQERFKCIAAAYYRGANSEFTCSLRILIFDFVVEFLLYFLLVVVTVFDASNLESLSTCQRWMDDAVGANRIVPLKFLVGTKIDLVVSLI
jgi:GTPase SAR1 family protein